MNDSVENKDVVGMSVELAVAWAANPSNRATPDEVMGFLKTAHGALTDLSAKVRSEQSEDEAFTPATTEKASLASREHIVSMIDGKKYKSLRRHLASHGLTPEQYRARYKLRHDYPMVSPDYSERRSAMAKAAGLGRKPGQKPARKAKKA